MHNSQSSIIMGEAVKILVVEEDMVIGANISLQLTKLGYETSGIVPGGEEALLQVKQNQPDIILMDIQLKGLLDGIETAKEMQKEYNIPIVYLTSNTNNMLINKAKATKPVTFIAKPFKKIDLKNAIELAVTKIKPNGSAIATSSGKESTLVLNDRIFVRNHERMVKIFIKDILYIIAERNYTRIFSKDKEYLLVMTLKDLDSKLPIEHFIRIHRSYIINLSQVDEVAGTHVVIAKKAIPLSKSLRGKLLNRLQTI